MNYTESAFFVTNFRLGEITQKRNKNNDLVYKLTLSGEKEGIWFKDRPGREGGDFGFQELTGKENWKALFEGDNPNSAIASDGYLFSFENKWFKEVSPDKYVAKIKPLKGSSIPVGSIDDLSLFIDPSSSSSPGSTDPEADFHKKSVAGSASVLSGVSLLATRTAIKKFLSQRFADKMASRSIDAQWLDKMSADFVNYYQGEISKAAESAISEGLTAQEFEFGLFSRLNAADFSQQLDTFAEAVMDRLGFIDPAKLEALRDDIFNDILRNVTQEKQLIAEAYADEFLLPLDTSVGVMASEAEQTLNDLSVISPEVEDMIIGLRSASFAQEMALNYNIQRNGIVSLDLLSEDVLDQIVGDILWDESVAITTDASLSLASGVWAGLSILGTFVTAGFAIAAAGEYFGWWELPF